MALCYFAILKPFIINEYKQEKGETLFLPFLVC